MNTKLRFKLIFTLIILSLIGMVVSQGYWLKSLYNSIWERTEKDIREAMHVADQKELAFRIKEVKKGGRDLGGLELKQNIGIGTTENEEEPEESGPADNETEELSSFYENYQSFLTQIEIFVLAETHNYIDSIQPISFENYHTILGKELQEKGIETQHVLRVIEKNAYYQYESSTDMNKWKRSVYFDHPVPGLPDQHYRLYIKSPERIVLYQMAGILISSFLLILLVISAFIYLLRTILRQKTVEELKTDFTNNVTHELKTPIAVAYAANDAMLNYDETVNEKQKKYLTIIKEQLDHLTGLVEQILTLSVENRTTFRLNPEPVRVRSLLPSLMEQHTLKTKKRVEFTDNLPDDLTVIADRTHLYNILSNLIENGIKYSDKEPVKITITGEKLPHETLLSVEDNGMGIHESARKLIFDKFNRVPQGNRHPVKGYGLGLYYIKDMMTKHKGSVSVKSSPGQGSVFTLHFTHKS